MKKREKKKKVIEREQKDIEDKHRFQEQGI
jgi:hypothetical protein